MTWRSFFRPATLLFMALWFVLLIGGQSRFFQDPGTFWHTVVGRQILTDRGFFDTDQFTFTFNGHQWIPHQWLGEVVMAACHAVDGFDSLLLMTATLLACLFTWLGVRLMRSGLHWSLSMVLVALTVAASSGHFHVRPHLASIVCFAVVMAFCCDLENGRIGLRRFAWLIPIFLVWSNIHGGMLGGLATLALTILGWTAAKFLGWPSPITSFREMLILAAILLACAATSLMNPYGIRLPETWIQIYQMQSLPQLIKEHAPIDLSERNAWMIVSLGVVYVVLLAGTFSARPRVVWLLPIVWFALACLRIRHAPLFAVGAVIAIADLIPRTRYAERLEAQGSDLFSTPEAKPDPIPLRERLAAATLPVLAVIAACILQAARVEAPVVGHHWARLDPTIWPVDFLDELQARQNERPDGTRIFDEYAYGGFLIYYAPGFRVFVDDRCELFGDQWLSEFLNTPDTGVSTEQWQIRYGQFDYALVYNHEGAQFAAYFRSDPDSWVEVKSSETTALFQRRE